MGAEGVPQCMDVDNPTLLVNFRDPSCLDVSIEDLEQAARDMKYRIRRPFVCNPVLKF